MDPDRRSFLKFGAAAFGAAALNPQALLAATAGSKHPALGLLNSDLMSDLFAALYQEIISGSCSEAWIYETQRGWLNIFLSNDPIDMNMHTLAKDVLTKSGIVPADMELTRENVEALLKQIPDPNSDYPVLDIQPNLMHQEVVD